MKVSIIKKPSKPQQTVPNVIVSSEYFKCRCCGYTVRIRTPRDTATCSQCGGTMDRY